MTHAYLFLFAGYGLSPMEKIHVSIAAVFSILAGLTILVLFLSRILKSHHEQIMMRCTNECQVFVNHVIWESQMPADTIKKLESVIRNSRFRRQLLIEYLVHNSKNFTGEPEQSIRKLYNELDLSQDSIRKLQSRRWHVVAKGISELAQFRHTDALSLIRPFLRSSNPILRNETRFAMMRLTSGDPLFFFRDMKEDLTPLMQINILDFLSKINPNKIPRLSGWLHSGNESIVVFSIKMIAWFMQMDAIEALTALLKDPRPAVVKESIIALGALEAYAAAGELVSLLPASFEQPEILKAMLQALGRIGDPALHGNAVADCLDHPDRGVRLAAAKALRQMGDKGKEKLMERVSPNDSVVLHADEPLLQ